MACYKHFFKKEKPGKTGLNSANPIILQILISDVYLSKKKAGTIRLFNTGGWRDVPLWVVTGISLKKKSPGKTGLNSANPIILQILIQMCCIPRAPYGP
jgi:hypothetical protein